MWKGTKYANEIPCLDGDSSLKAIYVQSFKVYLHDVT